VSVSFLLLNKTPEKNQLKKEERFILAHRLKVIVHSWLVHCFWDGGKAVHHGGVQMVEQTILLMKEEEWPGSQSHFQGMPP
jgi:hypothetical protein